MNLFPATALVPVETVSGSTPSEISRVLALPRRPPVACERPYSAATRALIEVVTERYAVPRPPRPDGGLSCACATMGHKCITELNAAQAWTLWELARGGVIGMIPVGAGKTAISLLAPLATGSKNAVLLAKSDQRVHYRDAWRRLREHFRVPSLVMDDGGEPMISRGAPVLRFIPYSKLSKTDSTKLLEDLNPDLIVADELHALAATTSARSIRFLRHMASRQGVRFCGWSGTLMDKSLRSVAHLAAHALGRGSPLPINPDDVEGWSAVLDPGPQPDRTSSTARAIYKAFGGKSEVTTLAEEFVGLKKVREGFRKRLVETPGVVALRSSSATCSITIREREGIVMPEAVKQALTRARAWVRPDGEELVEAAEQARCAREVASGFYLYWAFPRGEPEVLIKEWFEARQGISREMREKIMTGEEFFESRKLCENAAVRAWSGYDGPLPKWRAPSWPRWSAVKDRVVPDPRVKWLDDYLARDAAAWATEHRGVVWSLSRAFGRKVAEIAGIPYYGEGSEAEILADPGKTSIVASIRAHGEGRDGLQYKFSEQLIAEVPSGGKTLGQLLGRLARLGQKQDTVETWMNLHFSEARDALRRAMAQAEWSEDVTPVESLLTAADFTFDV